MRRGYGSSTEYFILQLPHCNYSLEEISKLLGLSTEYFRKNFLKIQEAKAKKGIVITRIGRGKNTLYGLEYK